MKRVGLRLKFAVLFILVVTVALGAAGLWSALSQQKQAEKEMLEKAQVLAQEMDAVWTFFETNQHQFKTDEQGNYELYCVIAAKSEMCIRDRSTTRRRYDSSEMPAVPR